MPCSQYSAESRPSGVATWKKRAAASGVSTYVAKSDVQNPTSTVLQPDQGGVFFTIIPQNSGIQNGVLISALNRTVRLKSETFCNWLNRHATKITSIPSSAVAILPALSNWRSVASGRSTG